jgi:hypothetical protein
MKSHELKNFRRWVRPRALAVMLAGGMLAAGCGSDETVGGQASAKRSDKAKKTSVAAAQVKPAVEDPQYAHMANAVVTGKTTAAVDLKYDVLTKPEPGRPFEIELALQPRVTADTLQVEITDMPGLAIVGERAAKFGPVAAGQTYTTRVLVQSDVAGLYYVSVIAQMITKVQSEARAFSVPVVVGAAPAATQKVAPQKDASGQAIQSMPATES